jgi:hypothetical protein
MIFAVSGGFLIFVLLIVVLILVALAVARRI